MIERAAHLADTLLFPAAQRVDQSSIPSSHFDALAEAGLFSLDGLSASAARRVIATIAGGCGATFFVWVQHHGVRRTLAGSDNQALRRELDEPFRAGTLIAGTAFAHVRRSGRPAVSARRVDGGWELDGVAPWATSWGIAHRFSTAAISDDNRIVWSMLPGDGGPGVTAQPLDLVVFKATGTVALRFDACFVADEHIIAIDELDRWHIADRRRASIGAPAVLGVAARAVRLLHDHAGIDADPASDVASRLDDALAAAWRRDDELSEALAELNDHDADDVIAEASDHRAACLDLGHRATTALLAAVGGRGIDLDQPAQRLAREAMFYVIQAQTADGRAATLRSL